MVVVVVVGVCVVVVVVIVVVVGVVVVVDTCIVFVIWAGVLADALVVDGVVDVLLAARIGGIVRWVVDGAWFSLGRGCVRHGLPRSVRVGCCVYLNVFSGFVL